MSDDKLDPSRLLRRPKTFTELRAALGSTHNNAVPRYMDRYRDIAKSIEVNGNKLYYVKGYPDNLGDKRKPQDLYLFVQFVMQNWISNSPARPDRETWRECADRFHRLSERAREFSEYCQSKVEPIDENTGYSEVEAAD